MRDPLLSEGDGDRYLMPKEVATLLGISTITVFRLRHTNQLPAVKTRTGMYLFDRADVLSYIKKHKARFDRFERAVAAQRELALSLAVSAGRGSNADLTPTAPNPH